MFDMEKSGENKVAEKINFHYLQKLSNQKYIRGFKNYTK